MNIVKEISDSEFAKTRSQTTHFWNEKTGKVDLDPWWKWGLGQDGEIYIQGFISGFVYTRGWAQLKRTGLALSAREIRLIAIHLLGCMPSCLHQSFPCPCVGTIPPVPPANFSLPIVNV